MCRYELVPMYKKLVYYYIYYVLPGTYLAALWNWSFHEIETAFLNLM